MARKRMIDPSIWTSESFGSLSNLGKIVFIGCISNADDEGRFKASSAYLRAVILPYGSETPSEIWDALEGIEREKIIEIYEVDGEKYGHLLKWDLYQTISRAYPSKLPPPPEISENKEVEQVKQNPKRSKTKHEQITNKSRSTHEPFSERSVNVQQPFSERSTLKEKKRKEVIDMSSKEILKDMKSIVAHYHERINSSSRLVGEAKVNIFARLKTYDLKSLTLAIDKFSSDEWWMEKNSGRGIAWFFKSDDRIEQFLNLNQPKEAHTSSLVGTPNASAYLEDEDREKSYGRS